MKILDVDSPAAPATVPRRNQALLLFFLLLTLLLLLGAVAGDTAGPAFAARFQTFVTLFLGIFIEAVPFLLAGSLVSGLIDVFVDRDWLARLIPRRPVPAALVGSFLGLAFPVCECGVVPVTRRLYNKGLPLPVGIAFLLSAPVINPVVMLSTYAAFGWSPILWGRLVLSVALPFIVGLLFTVARPDEVLLPENEPDAQLAPAAAVPALAPRFLHALHSAANDFLDMARYLIVGSMLAAGMQTLVPQAALLALGANPLTAVLSLMVLAFVLSVCSTVDAFLALSFVNTFPPAAILAFLVFGPMVDIKSSLMFLGVFRRRVVVYLILLPLLLTLAVALFLNLQLGLHW